MWIPPSSKEFPVAQMVKNLPVMQETTVESLGQEDPLDKGMATHCSILAWRISWTEKPGGLQFMGSQRVKHDWAANMHTVSFLCPFIHNFLSQPSRRSFGSLGLLSKHSLTKSSLTDFANSLRSQNTSDFLENSLYTQLPAFISLSIQDLTRVHSSLISRPVIYSHSCKH